MFHPPDRCDAISSWITPSLTDPVVCLSSSKMTPNQFLGGFSSRLTTMMIDTAADPPP